MYQGDLGAFKSIIKEIVNKGPYQLKDPNTFTAPSEQYNNQLSVSLGNCPCYLERLILDILSVAPIVTLVNNS